MRPLISIVVPVYNSGIFLAPCLDSLLAQTYRPLEIILVDDHSTDGSAEICREYSKKHSLIRVVEGSSQGANAGRWIGIASAKGEFVLCCDSDDLVHPELIQMLFHGICRSGLPVCACRYDTFGNSLPENEEYNNDKQPVIALRTPDHLFALLHDKRVDWGLWNKLYMRSFLTEAAFLNGYTYNEDLYTNWLLLKDLPGMALVDFVGYHYRQHDASISRRPLSSRHLSDQYSIAKQITADASKMDAPLKDSAQAFFYEKVTYLYSMIERQKDPSAFCKEKALYLEELRALRRSKCKIPLKIKISAVMALYFPHTFRFLCRSLLERR